MGKVKDRASQAKLSRTNVTKVSPSIPKKKRGNNITDTKAMGGKLNKIKKAKAMKTPPSPELQLGLKLDALLAKQTSPSETPSKKGKNRMKQGVKVREFSTQAKGALVGKNVKTTNVIPSKLDTTSKPQKPVGGRGIKRSSESVDLSSKKSKGPDGKPQIKKLSESNQPPIKTTELNRNKVLDIVRNVLKLSDNDQKDNSDGSSSPVFIQLTKKNPITQTSKIIRFPVTHSLVTNTSSVCLIVKTSSPGAEDSVKSTKDKLKACGVTNIKEVMPLDKFFENTQKKEQKDICDKFDYFLIDSSIAHRSNAKRLRRFSSQRKFPIPVRLHEVKNIKPEIEKSLAKTTGVVKKSPTTIFKIGHTSMTPQQIRDNIFSVWNNLDRLFPGGSENISGGAVKLADSKALSFYVPLVALKLPSEGQMDSEAMVWKAGQSQKNTNLNLNTVKKESGPESSEKKLTKNQKKKLKKKANALKRKALTQNGVAGKDKNKTNTNIKKDENKTNTNIKTIQQIQDKNKKATEQLASKLPVATKKIVKKDSSDEDDEFSDDGEEFSGDDVEEFINMEAEEASSHEETEDEDDESLTDSEVDDDLIESDDDMFDEEDIDSNSSVEDSDDEPPVLVLPKSMKKNKNAAPATASFKKGKQGFQQKNVANTQKKPFMKKAQKTNSPTQQFGKKKKGKAAMK